MFLWLLSHLKIIGQKAQQLDYSLVIKKRYLDEKK
jgi:hypothetical protein